MVVLIVPQSDSFADYLRVGDSFYDFDKCILMIVGWKLTFNIR